MKNKPVVTAVSEADPVRAERMADRRYHCRTPYQGFYPSLLPTRTGRGVGT